MSVLIYQPTKTAMQSGRAKTKEWILEHKPGSARLPDPLMGWSSAADTSNQIRLKFDTKDDAIAYAEKHSLEYTIQEPRKSKPKIKAYSDNFSFTRTGSWTH